MQKSTYTSLMIQNVIKMNNVYGSIQYPVLNNFTCTTYKTNLWPPKMLQDQTVST